MGKRRRSAASASPARVCAFSFASRRSRAICHSAADTIFGSAFVNFVFMTIFNDSTNQHSLPGQQNKHEGTKEPTAPGERHARARWRQEPLRPIRPALRKGTTSPKA